MSQPESSRRWCVSAIVRATTPVFLFMAAVLPVRAQAVFSQPVNISNSTGSSCFEQVAVDTFGNINAVWTHEESTPPFATTVFFSRSSNGGMAFTTPVAISHAGSPAGSGTVAVSPTGLICVVWVDNRLGHSALFFSSSADSGVTFSSPRAISNAGATSVSQGPLAVGASGNIDVVWGDNSSGTDAVFFSQSTNSGSSFTPPANLSSGLSNAEAPQMQLGGGDVYVVWTASPSSAGQADVFFSVSNNGGAIFSSPIDISNDPASEFVEVLNPQLAADSSGNVDIVWAWWDTSSPSSVFTTSHRRSSDGGLSFAAPYNFVSVCNDCSMAPQVALDSVGGGVNLVWTDFSFLTGGSAVPLFYARSVDGGATFGTEAVQGTAPFSPPQLAGDPASDIDVLFSQPVSAQPALVFTQSTDHGETFSQPQSISSAAYLNDFNDPVITTDKLSNAYLAWSQTDSNGNSNIFLSRSVSLSSLKINLPVVIAGGSATVSVTLSGPAPAGGALVSLSSSNSSSIQLPSSLTIPEGSTSATFRATANRWGVAGTVEITGSFGGITQSSSLLVRHIFGLGGLLRTIQSNTIKTLQVGVQ